MSATDACVELRVAYAVRGERILHVSEVPSGLACACHCPACGSPLIARRGRIRRHHFAHVGTTSCDGGVESLLHRLAKELLAELPSIRLPEYRYRHSKTIKGLSAAFIDREIVPAVSVKIDSIKLESRLQGFVPDAILERSGRSLLIEITVTHPVDRAKLRKIRRLDVACLEVRLSRTDIALSRHMLRRKLQDDESSKTWLFHPRQRAAEAEWVRQRRDLLARARAAKTAQGAEALYKVWRPRTTQGRRRSSGRAEWREYDRWADAIKRRTGRAPTLDEYRARAGSQDAQRRSPSASRSSEDQRE